MGMRIGGSNVATSAVSSTASQWQQRKQDMKDLMAALQSGDLAAAQKAYSALSPKGGSGRTDGPLAQIGQALQNGDVAGAQQVAQNWQAQQAQRHHGHHGHSGTSAGTAPKPASASPSGVGTLLNVTA